MCSMRLMWMVIKVTCTADVAQKHKSVKEDPSWPLSRIDRQQELNSSVRRASTSCLCYVGLSGSLAIFFILRHHDLHEICVK
jgi:hypothetical protein